MTSPHRRIRASDAEREEYAKMLRAAMAEGRLTLTDGEERLATAYATTYRDELDPLTSDLPGYGRRALFETPEFRDKERQHLRRHTGRVVSIAAILVGIWVLISTVAGPTFFWPAIPIAFLLVGLFRHRAWHRYSEWQREVGQREGAGWQGGPPWLREGAGWQGGGQSQGGPPWQRRQWRESGWYGR
jgi:hypothetical protein